MRRLAQKSTEDAAAVKVLTIITLVYLPATVVSVSHLLPLLEVHTAQLPAELFLDAICIPRAERQRHKSCRCFVKCMVIWCYICTVDTRYNRYLVDLDAPAK